jgi:NAD(P)H-nitrite reductase large subunit
MITSCICYHKTFREILVIAKENGVTSISTLRNKYKICNKCKLCNPYVEEALVTGQTEFTGLYKSRRKHDRKNEMP